MLSDYCLKCSTFVLAIAGSFVHPDLGERACKVCPKCGTMIVPKDDKEQEENV